MKTKKLSKRLKINKKTIANLDKNDLDNIRGGGCTYIIISWCDSCGVNITMVACGGGSGSGGSAICELTY